MSGVPRHEITPPAPRWNHARHHGGTPLRAASRFRADLVSPDNSLAGVAGDGGAGATGEPLCFAGCGARLPAQNTRYCSAACRDGTPSGRRCVTCGRALSRRQTRGCTQRCAALARNGPRPVARCAICQTPLGPRQRITCSLAHTHALIRQRVASGIRHGRPAPPVMRCAMPGCRRMTGKGRKYCGNVCRRLARAPAWGLRPLSVQVAARA